MRPSGCGGGGRCWSGTRGGGVCLGRVPFCGVTLPDDDPPRLLLLLLLLLLLCIGVIVWP